MSKFNEYLQRMEGAKYKSTAPGTALLLVGAVTITMSLILVVLGIMIAVYSHVEENAFDKSSPEEV